MHGVRPYKKCPENLIGTKQQIIKVKRGGPGTSGHGASGWKLRQSKVLAKALAEQASRARHRGRRDVASKPIAINNQNPAEKEKK